MPLNIDWQQILLHLFNFIILAAGLTFLLFKPVKKFMDARAEKYKKAADDYTRTVGETEVLEKERQVKISMLDSELAEREKQAAAMAENTKKRIIAAAESEADKIIVSSRHQAELERSQYMAEANDEMVTLILRSAEKLLAMESNARTDSALYDAYLSLSDKQEGVSERSRAAMRFVAEKLSREAAKPVLDRAEMADVIGGAAESAIIEKGEVSNKAIYDEFLKEVNNIGS